MVGPRDGDEVEVAGEASVAGKGVAVAVEDGGEAWVESRGVGGSEVGFELGGGFQWEGETSRF